MSACFFFVFCTCDKSDGISKGGIQDVQKSSQMRQGGLWKEGKGATVATSGLFEPAG